MPQQKSMSRVKVGEYTVDLMKEIGHGTFGTVYKGWHPSKGTVAAKKISTKDKKAISEVQIWNYLKETSTHDHIIRVYDVMRKYKDSIWIMMELCDLGDLNDFFITHSEYSQQLSVKIQLMKQITDGIAFLHNNDIVHRDIKLENILVKSEPRGQFLAKVGDFGLSKILDADSQTSAMSSDVGDLYFRAPELFDSKQRYHRDVDVYAAGITFTAMLQAQPGKILVPKAEGSVTYNVTGVPIGFALNTCKVSGNPPFTLVENNPNDDNSTKEVKDLIRKMTHFCPEQRLRSSIVQQILNRILLVSCMQSQFLE